MATDDTTPAPSRNRLHLVRSVYARRDLELFLVVAIATILLVRTILAMTGWPQLGGGKIHFAHLLWGGLGMLVALVLLMAMEGRAWKGVATLSAGIGFGLFIDELGKFITSDNDYFFQPVIAIIYVIFVALLLTMRAITRDAAAAPQSALVNAFDLAKEAVIRDMDPGERDEALRLLARCEQSDPIVSDLRNMLERMRDLPVRQPQPYERLRAWLTELYRKLVPRRWFKRTVIGWYLVISLAALVSPLVGGEGSEPMSFAQVGQLVSALVSGSFVVIALVRWRRSALSAYRWLERSVLVVIFVYEVFAFYEEQLETLFGLVLVLITWVTIRYMVRQEEVRHEEVRQMDAVATEGA
jgi:hypothetical protein